MVGKADHLKSFLNCLLDIFPLFSHCMLAAHRVRMKITFFVFIIIDVKIKITFHSTLLPPRLIISNVCLFVNIFCKCLLILKK